ncbi:SseB family protein [Brevundimonas sp.]|uniref:SseB family protein n=1 Tax=Brevundimonas sp. TaxID=1871086 RepID=UPI0028993052|nr:SseB family protein [Brevundimonas sp.]
MCLGLSRPLSRLFGSGRGRTAPHATKAVFKPLNSLEALLTKATTAPRRETFLTALLDSPLYAATPHPKPTDRAFTLGEVRAMGLLKSDTKDGQSLPALFTARDRIATAFGPDVGSYALHARQMLQLFATEGAVLNFGTYYQTDWTAQDVADLLSRPFDWTLAPGTSGPVGRPTVAPAELIDAIETALSPIDGLTALWLALDTTPDQPRRWQLDIHTDLDHRTLRPHLHNAHTVALATGLPLYVRFSPAKTTDGTGLRLLASKNHLNS